MKGCSEEFKTKSEYSFSDMENPRFYINSMWNKLMLPIHENAPDKWYKDDPVEIPTDDWNVNYTDSDLEIGAYTICQEDFISVISSLWETTKNIKESLFEVADGQVFRQMVPAQKMGKEVTLRDGDRVLN